MTVEEFRAYPWDRKSKVFFRGKKYAVLAFDREHAEVFIPIPGRKRMTRVQAEAIACGNDEEVICVQAEAIHPVRKSLLSYIFP